MTDVEIVLKQKLLLLLEDKIKTFSEQVYFSEVDLREALGNLVDVKHLREDLAARE